jgi:hypothetical protein
VYFSTSPSIFLNKPKAIFAVVLFPEPLGPISVTILPFSTSSDTPLTSH